MAICTPDVHASAKHGLETTSSELFCFFLLRRASCVVVLVVVLMMRAASRHRSCEEACVSMLVSLLFCGCRILAFCLTGFKILPVKIDEILEKWRKACSKEEKKKSLDPSQQAMLSHCRTSAAASTVCCSAASITLFACAWNGLYT